MESIRSFAPCQDVMTGTHIALLLSDSMDEECKAPFSPPLAQALNYEDHHQSGDHS